MYSQKSEFGKVMIAWKEYGPEPWGTTGISYAAAILLISHGRAKRGDIQIDGECEDCLTERARTSEREDGGQG
jgi:hypothetical protein